MTHSLLLCPVEVDMTMEPGKSLFQVFQGISISGKMTGHPDQ